MAGPHAFDELGLAVLQRDWLSANHCLFAADGAVPATIVDTGHARHAPATLALVDQALDGTPLGRIVNTHLHSDHCGGNQALQARQPGLQTWIPAASLPAVQAWNQALLSYAPTGQRCDPFRADRGLRDGERLRLGRADWQVHAAPGHDPQALMLFEPQTRTLIAGDALWEDRLAIIFPELDGDEGFAPARRTLDLIESLAPRRVVPGHGAVFADAEAALAASRRRLDAFEREPLRHMRHAARALLMFHLMEHGQRQRTALQDWLLRTPIFARMAARLAHPAGAAAWTRELIDSLLDDGLLAEHDGVLHLGDPTR